MSDKPNLLLEALPPATDYITYLALLEYNLTVDNLPTLHEVLQDPKLTINIGWDLVHLLLPLLPQSEECLRDLARLGNPREVVLKATESLRLIEFNELHDERSEDGSEEVAVPGAGEGTSNQPNAATDGNAPLPVMKFLALLDMLSILHPRIKTKHPSRFLSTTLQAVLSSYSEAGSYMEELTAAAVKFIKALSGTRRPHLPPRRSSSRVVTASTQSLEPDPEGQEVQPTPEELALQKRLMQSFLTHVLEDYFTSLQSEGDVPGMAWSARLQEKLHPDRLIPNKATFADRFANEDSLQSRISTMGQIVLVAKDLDVDSKELFATLIDDKAEETGKPSEEDEPPETAEDIPLSKTGSLYLFAARNVSEILYSNSTGAGMKDIQIFPDHATILKNFIGTLSAETSGLEPEPLIDTIIALGLIAVENNQIGEPEDDERFTQYLQTMSLLSANCPSPTLRFHAHYITSTVLRSHPSDLVRLSFIRDTLEHCPYENLKATAVGWIKGETLEANLARPTASTTQSHGHTRASSSASSSSKAPLEPEAAQPSPALDTVPHSIFATPVALESVWPFLFPDLSHLTDAALPDAWLAFRVNLSFYLAALNFYALLVAATPLHGTLDMPGLHKRSGIERTFMGPLMGATEKFREALDEGGALREVEDKEGAETGKAELGLLGDVLRRIEQGLKAWG
ncbi:YAP-binding/ALF4/Glomulin [Lineolata rhizophorae]|uniref:YAP-binding/ALF4/Glomulin n=1 Tax=Lineolata rhizophorae TaxID=578093 RepID=A0A6A6PDQ9_9PEZI|nr:YAP-binding/ALF4/Glomulin [Lineolata rhizophorae]